MKPLACGLDISDYSAELVGLSQMKGLPRAEAIGRMELPAGLIRRGIIQEPDKLAGLLDGFLDQVLGARRANITVGVSLPETLVYSKVFRLPANLGPELAAKAAALSAADIFPLPLNDIASGIMVLARSKETQDLLYAVAEGAAVQAYRDVLRRIRIEPAFIEPESLALSRAVIDGDELEPVLLADIGAATTMLAVYDGAVAFSSNIALGGNRLTSAIEVQLNIPLDKAENLKRRAGFDPAAETGRVMLILQKPMTEIIGEMKRTIDFYGQRTGRQVRKIVLAGGTSLVPEIAAYVASNLTGIEVVNGRPFRETAVDHLSSSKDLKTNAIFYATALGLALRAGRFRPGPGLDLVSDGHGGGRGAGAIIDMARQAVSNLFSMVRRKATKHPKTAAAEKKLPPQLAEETTASPSAEPVTETPQAAAPAAAPPPEAAPPAAPEPEMPAAEEPPLAHAVSSLLDSSRYDVPGGEPQAEPKAAEQPDGMPVITQRGSRVMWVDSIIAGNKSAPPEDDDGTGGGRGARKPHFLVWILLILLLVGLAGGGVYMFGKKAGLSGVSLLSSVQGLFQKGADKLQGTPVGDTGAVNAPALQPVGQTVSEIILVGLEKRPGGTSPSVASRVVETDVTASDDFAATGTATVKSSGIAGGKLTIINKTAEAYTFVATTRCLSKEGVLFRLKSATNIPANGSVEATVYADKPGASGDIGPTTFTIPGLSADLQKVVYAESSAAMSGGGSTAKGVSDADLAAAKNALLDQLKTESLADLKAMANSSELVLPELVTSQELSVKAPTAGTAGDEFNMKLTARFRALLIPQIEIESILTTRLKDTLPAGAALTDYELGSVQYTVEAYDTETDLAEVRVEAPVKHR